LVEVHCLRGKEGIPPSALAVQPEEVKVTSPGGTQNLLILWASDTQIQDYAGGHWRVAVAAYSGISVWSLAFRLMVYGSVKRHRRREQEHLRESTAIGYFYTGFEL